VTPKKLVFLGVLGLADYTPGREPRSIATSYSDSFILEKLLHGHLQLFLVTFLVC